MSLVRVVMMISSLKSSKLQLYRQNPLVIILLCSWDLDTGDELCEARDHRDYILTCVARFPIIFFCIVIKYLFANIIEFTSSHVS